MSHFDNAVLDLRERVFDRRAIRPGQQSVPVERPVLQVHPSGLNDEKTLQLLCRAAYEERDWKALETWSARLLARRPASAEAQIFRGRAASRLRDWTGAAEAWASVVRHRPGWAEGHFQLVRALFRSGRKDQAREAITALAALAPRQQTHADFLLQASVEVGDCRAALIYGEELVGLDPATAERRLGAFATARNHRGVALLADALLRSALSSERAEGLRNAITEALAALAARAAAEERAGDLEKAHHDHTAALLVDPGNGPAQRSVMRIERTVRAAAQEAQKAGDLQSARDRFRLLAEFNPEDLDAQVGLGRVLMCLGDWSAAVPVWRRVAAERPQRVEGHLQLARALSRSGEESEALPVWRHILALEPDHKEAAEMTARGPARLLAHGRAALAADDPCRAAEILLKARTIDPTNADIARRLEQTGRKLLQAMRAAFKASDMAAVLDCGALANRLRPDDPAIQLLIGRAAMALRACETAIPAWERLADLDPSSRPLCELQLARCYVRLRRKAEAQAALRQVLLRDPVHAEARALLARLQTDAAVRG